MTLIRRTISSSLFLVFVSVSSVPDLPGHGELPVSAKGTPAISFSEVTEAAGVAYSGRSWGASWGDFDGDGWLDLWVGNHQLEPSLFINQGDGTFIDIAAEANARPKGDFHAAQWADFDNDGDQDLVQVAGGGTEAAAGENVLYVNDNGVFVEQGSEFGVHYPPARGRTPLWLDADGDGLLDMIQTVHNKAGYPTTLFQQTATGFDDVGLRSGGKLINTSLWAQLADLDGDQSLEVAVHGYRYPAGLFDIGSIPLTDADVALPVTGSGPGDVSDSVFADFDGDLRNDLVLPSFEFGSGFLQRTDLDLQFALDLDATEHGVSFQAGSEIVVELCDFCPTPEGPGRIDLSRVFIGSSATNPSSPLFALSPTDPTVEGIVPHTPGVDTGAYIGFDPEADTWQILCSAPGSCRMEGLVVSSQPITDIQPIGFATATPESPTMYRQTDSGFIDVTDASGLEAADCTNAVAADFDNDMDVDLYFACMTQAGNAPNQLYENAGDGTFSLVPGAGGALGTELGKADGVAVADYDNDGYLDLFVVNGKGPHPINNGVNQLFRNEGSGNHWLEIDLIGTVSNRDGIGATALVTAGGVTQMRERNGGIHSTSQNAARLHFGLASNSVIDEITIYWPSGTVQTIRDVIADQVLTIREGPSLEVGTAVARSSWSTVLLDEEFVDPVVIVGPPSTTDPDAVVPRVRNITPASFQVRLESWAYQTRWSHGPELLSYLVLERGSYALGDGTGLEAGSVSIGLSLTQVPFSTPFEEAPAVLNTIVTADGSAPVTVRIGRVGATAHSVRLQVEEAQTFHPQEQVDYVAWEIGADSNGQPPWETSTALVGDAPVTVTYELMTAPCIFAASNSAFEHDPITVRHANLTTTSVDLFLGEEQSADAELAHAPEVVAILAIDCGQ